MATARSGGGVRLRGGNPCEYDLLPAAALRTPGSLMRLRWLLLLAGPMPAALLLVLLVLGPMWWWPAAAAARVRPPRPRLLLRAVGCGAPLLLAAAPLLPLLVWRLPVWHGMNVAIRGGLGEQQRATTAWQTPTQPKQPMQAVPYARKRPGSTVDMVTARWEAQADKWATGTPLHHPSWHSCCCAWSAPGIPT